MKNSFFEEPEFTVIAFSSSDVLCGVSGPDMGVGEEEEQTDGYWDS